MGAPTGQSLWPFHKAIAPPTVPILFAAPFRQSQTKRQKSCAVGRAAWQEAAMSRFRNLLGGVAVLLLFAALVAWPLTSVRADDRNETIAPLKRAEASSAAWIDCAADRVAIFGADRSITPTDAATAATDGCLAEVSAHRRNLEALFPDLPDWRQRADELYEGTRTSLIRALSAHVVQARAKMGR